MKKIILSLIFLIVFLFVVKAEVRAGYWCEKLYCPISGGESGGWDMYSDLPTGNSTCSQNPTLIPGQTSYYSYNCVYPVSFGNCGTCNGIADPNSEWRPVLRYGLEVDCAEGHGCPEEPTQTPDDPTPTPAPPGGSPLPCATGFNVTCNTAVNQATVSWNPINGAVGYILRVNKDPYGVWPGDGDIWKEPTGNSQLIDITPAVNYLYDVQGRKSGEVYPYSGARCPFAVFNCQATGPTATPTPAVPTVTPNPNCICNADACTSSCIFDRFGDPITYANPIKCSLSDSIFSTPPTDKNIWCQRNMRTKGDADGVGGINSTDYFYYVSAVNGGKIPLTVNPDFNGDGEVGASDRAIIVKSLTP